MCAWSLLLIERKPSTAPPPFSCTEAGPTERADLRRCRTAVELPLPLPLTFRAVAHTARPVAALRRFRFTAADCRVQLLNCRTRSTWFASSLPWRRCAAGLRARQRTAARCAAAERDEGALGADAAALRARRERCAPRLRAAALHASCAAVGACAKAGCGSALGYRTAPAMRRCPRRVRRRTAPQVRLPPLWETSETSETSSSEPHR